MLDKTYDPKLIESKIYPAWEASGVFSPLLDGLKPTYTIMMPPPNVTGSLHIGHALNHTLQDIMVRYHRMKGYDVLWQPGTDHAGIATQMVVERQMDKEGLSRRELGREKFLERVWKWKEHSGGTIVHQLRRLGVSPDWTRERFTMDEGLSVAVRKVFVELYQKGLIFRDKRLVNWDPKLLTAVSDLEVENKETKGKMWRIRYPVEGGGYITIATTRPETMLGDTGVAVHPEDTRYTQLIGKNVVLPLTQRKIPIVADEYSDPDKGTGAVKITPAHDFNDFEVGKRHGLQAIDIFDIHACVNENAPEEYRGLDRKKARELVLQKLTELDLLEGEDEITHAVPVSERSGDVIEPRLTEQWYVDAYTLAQPAIKVVEEGEINFVPKNWELTYFQWLKNIQPWCISRQLWWGHRIPAWYGPDDYVFVADSEQDAQTQASQHYGKTVELRQDEDVLDTWFSAALWPFSTLGWPEETNALAKCYPGDLLITGHDIIFFWVARMIMMGLEFMKDVPFKTVYITALVRDEKGQKMSKSKGNVVDPLEFIDLYGADAIRFSLAALAGPGRNVNFSKSQVEGYRNFTTKLWNSARFCEHHQCLLDPDFDPKDATLPINKWVIAEIEILGQNLAKQLENYRYDEACAVLYQFIWGQFCDWYVELVKPIFFSGSEEDKSETRKVAAWTLGQILHLLHPFMPFVTEELWQHLSGGKELISSQWPVYASTQNPLMYQNTEAQNDINWVIKLISEIRATRSEMNVPASAMIELSVAETNEDMSRRIELYGNSIEKLARLSSFKTQGDENAAGAIQFLVDNVSYHLLLGNVVNMDEERKRLAEQLKSIQNEIKSLDQKLSQPDFVAKAPADVVEKNQARLNAAQEQKHKIEQALSRLQ